VLVSSRADLLQRDIFSTHWSLPLCAELIGYDMAVKAASEAYQQAGVGPGEVDVVELHDCFSTNELITYEALVCWTLPATSGYVATDLEVV